MEERLRLYVQLLLKWNKKINLIAPSTEQGVWQRHIEDSLQLASHVSRETNIIDIGSGGGLPGIVLAIATNKPTILIESDKRKCIFLEQVSRELKLPVTVINQRIEATSCPDLTSHCTITARALADLSKIFELVSMFAEKNNLTDYSLLLLKGENVSRETSQAQSHWAFELEEFQSQTNKNSKILKISNLKKL